MPDYQVVPDYLSGLAELDMAELPRYLDKVRNVFNVDGLVAQDIDSQDVVKYYEQSSWGYKFFHSDSGAIHMALNYDGKFDPEGYLGQARVACEQIHETNAREILELASGKGFNSIYLAKSCVADAQYRGIDLTPLHVSEAQANASELSNVRFQQGNFQELPFGPDSFDLVFVIESLCYATDMRRALSEAFRVLRPGGRFVVIDGFRKKPLEKFDSNIRLAAVLVEKAMAVPEGWVLGDWIDLAKSEGFHLVESRDVSEAIMPNLMRFHVMAKGYFKFSLVSRVIEKVLPPYMIGNAIAGLLMPYTVSAGLQGYFVEILEKQS